MKKYILLKIIVLTIIAFGLSESNSFGQTTVYLSDYNWNSASTGWGSVQKDKSADNNTLTIGGVTYQKGIGTHAYSVIEYNLNNISGGGWKTFQAIIGRDDEADGCNCGSQNIVFAVEVDGVRTQYMHYGVNQGGQQISINVEGKSTLKLIVDDAGDQFWGDHGDWVDAKLTRNPIDPPNPTGTCVYLSDYNWNSASTGWGSVQKDKSADNNTLTIGGVTYQKGIGTHSYSVIEYNLNNISGGGWKTFQAIIGRDDEADGCNCGSQNIVFAVEVDGVRTQYMHYGVNQGGQQISINVEGKSTLKLIVDDAGDQFWGDHGDWADAKLCGGGGGNPTCSTEIKQIVEVRQECVGGTFDQNNGSPNNNGGVKFTILPQYPTVALNCPTYNWSPSPTNQAVFDNINSNSFYFKTNGSSERSKTGRTNITLLRNSKNYAMNDIWSSTCDHKTPTDITKWENVNCPENNRSAVITSVNNNTNTNNYPVGTEIYVELKDNSNNYYKISSVGAAYHNVGVSACTDVSGGQQMKYKCTVQSNIFTIQVQPDKFQANLLGTCHGWTRYYYFGNDGSIDNPNARVASEQYNSKIEQMSELLQDINLHPNAVEDKLNFEYLTKQKSGKAIIEIYDMLGIVQLSKEISFDNGILNGSVSVRYFKTGTYIFKVVDENNVVAKKFVKE